MADKTSPLKYLTEVRAEAKKVSWPTRKEVVITSAMVLAMVLVAGIFFFIVDMILGWGVRSLLMLGR
jgi:preprotein translocase subunit SecE